MNIINIANILYSVVIVSAGVLAYLWVFWLLYVTVMGLYRAWLAQRLRGLALIMSLPIVFVALIVDWVANWTIAVAVFQELPMTPYELVTGRLSRYIKAPYDQWNWRNRLADEICDGLLDYFDPTGKHCR